MLSITSLAFGFSPAQKLQVQAPTCSATRASVHCGFESVAPRRTVLAAAALGLGATGAAPARAGYVTSLGIVTTSPKDAERDDELFATKQVQDGLNGLKGYQSAAKTLQASFKKDKNMALIPAIRKEFDFAAIRDNLNIVATIFDDQTQLTIDRNTRAILYDLTELENAARFKKGETERTAKKVENVDKWFVKLDADLNMLLAYFK
mmetsp:Transcript_16463/g.39290  ORF Transcript_16463/g.39290 Transcript_16463/m.39290 type:complete len:206 (-) Transcript_16463:261-878(-)